ncbi:aldehyde dehydrogenase family protein [Planctomycetota bacterium]|nr:aldehyde dehydrogenase family protein [Planctomycetota bacterium]
MSERNPETESDSSNDGNLDAPDDAKQATPDKDTLGPENKLASPLAPGSEFETGAFEQVPDEFDTISDADEDPAEKEETDRAPDEDVISEPELPTKIVAKTGTDAAGKDPFDDLETREVPMLSDDVRAKADRAAAEVDGGAEVVDEWEDDGGLADSVQSSMLPEDTKEILGPVVAAGRRALTDWSALRLEERIDYFDLLRNEMVVYRNDYVPSLASALGRPMVETLCGEYIPALDALLTIEETISPLLVGTPGVEAGRGTQGARAVAAMKPWGVVLIAAPKWGAFGVPLVMAIDALAAGNAVIICGEDTHPRANDMLQRMMSRAKFPEGLVQVITGGTETLMSLCSDRPDKVICLRGDTCREKLGMICAQQGIDFSAIGQTKDTLIIAGDADLDRAATVAAWGAFAAGGAPVGSIERIIVSDALFDEFRMKFIDRVRNMNSHHAQLANLKDIVDQRRFNHLLEDVVAKGGRVTHPAGESPGRWIHWKAAVLENVSPKSMAATSGLNGPGVALYRAEDCIAELRILLEQAPVGQLAVLGRPGKAARASLEALPIPALMFGEPWVYGVAAGGSMVGPALIRTLCGPAMMLRPSVKIVAPEDGTRVGWFPYADDKAHALMDAMEPMYSLDFKKRLKGNIKLAMNVSQRRILDGKL